MTRMSEKREKLKMLRERALKDSLPLKNQANSLVFGNGTADTDIVFLGEAPGFHEDQKGIPFCGQAGALLNQMLSRVGMDRESVFTTNMLMYRPPNNRDPLPQELKAFQKYVDGILEIIDPKVVVTLGRFSMGKFLPGAAISTVHGKQQSVSWRGKNIVVYPMYHPAAALRNGEVKRKFIEDFDRLPEVLAKSDLGEYDEVKTSDQMELL